MLDMYGIIIIFVFLFVFFIFAWKMDFWKIWHDIHFLCSLSLFFELQTKKCNLVPL